MNYLIGNKNVFAIEMEDIPSVKIPLFGGSRLWIQGRYICDISVGGSSFWAITLGTLSYYLDKRNEINLSETMFMGESIPYIHRYFRNGLRNDDTSSDFYKFLFSIGEPDDDFSTFLYFRNEHFHFVWRYWYWRGKDPNYVNRRGETFGGKIAISEWAKVTKQFELLFRRMEKARPKPTMKFQDLPSLKMEGLKIKIKVRRCK